MDTTTVDPQLLVGVPDRHRDIAVAVLAGHADLVGAVGIQLLAEHSAGFAPELCVALYPHLLVAGRRVLAANASGLIEDLATDRDPLTRAAVLKNRSATPELYDRVVWGLRNEQFVGRLALTNAVTNPAMPDEWLATLPTSTVAQHAPERLAGPDDPDGLAEVVRSLYGTEYVPLAETRELARLVLDATA